MPRTSPGQPGVAISLCALNAAATLTYVLFSGLRVRIACVLFFLILSCGVPTPIFEVLSKLKRTGLLWLML